MSSAHFIDGVELNRQNPNSFFIPSPEDVAAIVPGDRVKIGLERDAVPGEINGERFWLEVTEVEGTGSDRRITGELITGLIVFDIELGEEFTVEARHILDIQ